MEQIRYWEEQRAAILEELAKCDKALAGLRAANSDSQESPPVPPQAAAKKWLTGAQEIRRAVEAILPDLYRHFTRPDVENALGQRGFWVATSTLRVVLLEMANEGGPISVSTKGSGRRATVFDKGYGEDMIDIFS